MEWLCFAFAALWLAWFPILAVRAWWRRRRFRRLRGRGFEVVAIVRDDMTNGVKLIGGPMHDTIVSNNLFSGRYAHIRYVVSEPFPISLITDPDAVAKPSRRQGSILVYHLETPTEARYCPDGVPVDEAMVSALCNASDDEILKLIDDTHKADQSIKRATRDN